MAATKSIPHYYRSPTASLLNVAFDELIMFRVSRFIYIIYTKPNYNTYFILLLFRSIYIHFLSWLQIIMFLCSSGSNGAWDIFFLIVLIQCKT